MSTTSTRPTVYLAGPITGKSFESSVSWREYTKSRLAEEGIIGLSPMRAKDYLAKYATMDDTYQDEHPLSKPAGIVTRDRQDCMTSDAVIVYLEGADRVSIGTMMELGWADAARVPLIVVHEPGGIHDHSMVRQVAGFLCDDLDEAIEVAVAMHKDRVGNAVT